MSLYTSASMCELKLLHWSVMISFGIPTRANIFTSSSATFSASMDRSGKASGNLVAYLVTYHKNILIPRAAKVPLCPSLFSKKAHPQLAKKPLMVVVLLSVVLTSDTTNSYGSSLQHVQRLLASRIIVTLAPVPLPPKDLTAHLLLFTLSSSNSTNFFHSCALVVRK